MSISYLYNGEPMNGTVNDDFVIAFKGSTGTDNNTIYGNEGDDLVIADSSDTWLPTSSYTNGSIANAFNLDALTGPWTTAENPMFGDDTIPHTTVMAEATIGQSEYFHVAIGAGQQIIIDIDFASNTAIGTSGDLVVELQDSLGNIIASGDDSLVTDGGRGSTPSTAGGSSTYDPYLVYTVASAGDYYINVRPFGAGPGSTFTANNTFVMNVSVTGHAVNATNPIQGDDTINGGDGDDTLFGQGGADIINGGNGNDTIDGGSGGDIVHGDAGNDILYGGDGTEENIHGDADDDILYSGGEGHYYGDDGNDTIYAGLTSGVNEVLDGGTGVDTLDTTTWNGAYVINMVTGATDFGESFTNFENVVTGNGADTITGTDADNVISTRGGTDNVDGGAGDDRVSGGAAGDTLNGGTGSDILDYRSSSGAVTINLAANSASGGDATGDVITNFEGAWGSNLGDTLTGTAGANELRGFAGIDTLVGDSGNDLLEGGAGADVLDGGVGIDTLSYAGSVGGVTASLASNSVSGGDATGDTISNFENLEGSSFADTLSGDAAVNYLYGLGSDDVLNGGAGADVMFGGLGDDTYVVDNALDQTKEASGEGTDLVQASLGWTLAGGVENLTLTGSAAINGTGNGLANVIRGNGAANVLDGAAGNDSLIGNGGNDSLIGGAGNDVLNGGTGNDAMTGGTGNDTYYVDSASDTVTENASEGTDLVASNFSYALGANLENLTLLGTADLGGTGNGLANVIRGNAGANVLNGGAGDDALSGYAGDDTFIVDSSRDRTYELAGGGADTVYASASFRLGVNVEDLTLTGSGAIKGIGNDIANVLTGNGGANALYGLGGNDTLIGGAAKDTLIGGAGNDTFLFDDGDFGGATRATADRITDFTSGADTIDLGQVDANSLMGGDQGFTFIGTAAFSGSAGQLRYEQISGNTYVSGDTNGDGIADFMIALDGLHTMVGGDFGL